MSTVVTTLGKSVENFALSLGNKDDIDAFLASYRRLLIEMVTEQLDEENFKFALEIIKHLEEMSRIR